MAFEFKIEPSSNDIHQMNDYWLAVIIPYKNQETFSRDSMDSISNLDGVEEDELILIDNDCVSWQFNATKENHVSSLNLELLPTTINYMNKVNPEDWIVFWAFNNFEDFKFVKAKLASRENERINQFKTAPKFIGKVHTIFKNKSVDLTSGKKHLNFSVTAYGFGELDSNMYFDQIIKLQRPSALKYLHDFLGVKGDLTTSTLIEGHVIIPLLLFTCLGLGPATESKVGGATDSKRYMSANEAHQIPATIVDILFGNQKPLPAKSVGYTYADILKMTIGVQVYDGNSFIPLSNDRRDNVDKSIVPLNGIHQLQPVYWNNQSVWSILNTYLADPINEMYTAMRINANGFVMPTIVCRQVPFSTKRLPGLNVTTFTDLPRWTISDSLVLDLRVGRSNVLRQNYIMILPVNAAKDERAGKEMIASFADPIVDPVDIKRAGLKPMIKQIGATFNVFGTNEDAKVVRFYNELMADMTFGSHLKYTGTAVVKGIQEPICQGDNCVIDNVIYHIEGVTHQGSISFDGKKDFVTVLRLSNGISVESDRSPEFIYPDQKPSSNDAHLGLDFERIT
jgi:hypothetical protein